MDFYLEIDFFFSKSNKNMQSTKREPSIDVKYTTYEKF